MTKAELRDIIIKADAIDWTKDSEYIRIMSEDEEIGADGNKARHSPLAPMSPFGDRTSDD
tara:strand:+ start:397 stop:576 length:180 start_codon:yes stop_codon:yes gene_type:complete